MGNNDMITTHTSSLLLKVPGDSVLMLTCHRAEGPEVRSQGPCN